MNILAFSSLSDPTNITHVIETNSTYVVIIPINLVSIIYGITHDIVDLLCLMLEYYLNLQFV